MNELKAYYKQQADTQPEPLLSAAPLADAIVENADLFEPIEGESVYPAQTAQPRPSTRARAAGMILAACAMVVLVAVPVWLVNGNGLFGGRTPEGTVFAPGAEIGENGPPADEKDEADEVWELLYKYAGADHDDWRTDFTLNAFSIARVNRSTGGTLRTGRSNYAYLPSFLAALEGTGFCFPNGFMGPEKYFDGGLIIHPLKSETPVNEWAEGKYVVREYEADPDMVAGYFIYINSNDNEKFWTIRAYLHAGYLGDGDRDGSVEIEGWEMAAVYTDDAGGLHLTLAAPVPGNMNVPKYDTFPPLFRDPYQAENVHSVCYGIYGLDSTLEELIAIAETIR